MVFPCPRYGSWKIATRIASSLPWTVTFHFRECVLESLCGHPDFCFGLFGGHLAPPFTVHACKWIVVGCLNFDCWSRLAAVALCLSSWSWYKMLLRTLKSALCHSALIQSSGTWRNSVLYGLVLSDQHCSSYNLQFHLLRTSKIVPCVLLPELEVSLSEP